MIVGGKRKLSLADLKFRTLHKYLFNICLKRFWIDQMSEQLAVDFWLHWPFHRWRCHRPVDSSFSFPHLEMRKDAFLGIYGEHENLLLHRDLWLVFIGPESDHWLCLSVTHWLTHSLPFSKLNWCEPVMWKWQLKTCWSCWWWETVYSVTFSIQFLKFVKSSIQVDGVEAEVRSRLKSEHFKGEL